MKNRNALFLLSLPFLLSACSIRFGPGASSNSDAPSAPDSFLSEESSALSSEEEKGSSPSSLPSEENSSEAGGLPSSKEGASSEERGGKDVFYDGGHERGGEDSSSSAPGKFYYWFGRDYGLGGEVNSFSSSEGEYAFSYRAYSSWYSVQLFYQAPYAEKGDRLHLSFAFLSDSSGKITINGDVVPCQANVWAEYSKEVVVGENSQGFLSTFSIQLGEAETSSCLSGSSFRFQAPKILSEDPYSEVLFQNGGEVCKRIQVKNGRAVSCPPSPSAPSGSFFAGWYDGDLKWDPSLTIDTPHSFSARFQKGEEPMTSYVPEGYSLSWADEFEGTSLKESNWECQLGVGQSEGLWEWGNQEKQYYKKENAKVFDGKLEIEAKKETTPYGNASYAYTSARIRSKGKVHFARGYVEARISLPLGQGLWPAFWMLPESSFQGKGWPYSGEIDIMEARGRLPYESTSALHYSYDGGSGHTYQTERHALVDPLSSYHVYSLLWEETQIVFSVDGQAHLTVPSSVWMGAYNGNDPFGEDFHILFNLAVGGSFDGGLLPDSSFSSASMKVDYVRVYRK